jgi:hypothetical protein
MVAWDAIQGRMWARTRSRGDHQSSWGGSSPRPQALGCSLCLWVRGLAQRKDPDPPVGIQIQPIQAGRQGRSRRHCRGGGSVEVGVQYPAGRQRVLPQDRCLVKKFTKCYGREEFGILEKVKGLGSRV